VTPTGSRRKVLFLIPSLTGGGAERVFTTLLRHLDRTRFEPQLAALEVKGAYAQDVPYDVVIHNLNVSRVRYALPHIIMLIWKTRPTTVISTLGHLNIALAMCKRLLPHRVRVVIREAVVVSALLPEETQHLRLWTWLYRCSYRQADKVICLSDSMLEDMVNSFGLPRGKMVRIYNPVDIDRVREQAARGINPYTAPGPHLVAAGRLTRQKGFDLLLDAMPIVLQSFPTARLTILGEGVLRATLEEQSRGLGIENAVSFTGFEQNPWRYLKNADVFVLPSRYEGLPNVMLEALALETPVIATDCPGAIREVHEATSGISLVPMENPKALADAVIKVCSSAKNTNSLRVSRVDLRKFSLQHVVLEYSSLF
jgi:glycosyltransferase involved in cell wall biosynthesis